MTSGPRAGLALGQIEDAFQQGAQALVLSNPNNPAGAVHSAAEIGRIAALLKPGTDRFGPISRRWLP